MVSSQGSSIRNCKAILASIDVKKMTREQTWTACALHVTDFGQSN